MCFASENQLILLQTQPSAGLEAQSLVFRHGFSTKFPKSSVDDSRLCWKGFVSCSSVVSLQLLLAGSPNNISSAAFGVKPFLMLKAVLNTNENGNCITCNNLYILVSNLRLGSSIHGRESVLLIFHVTSNLTHTYSHPCTHPGRRAPSAEPSTALLRFLG